LVRVSGSHHHFRHPRKPGVVTLTSSKAGHSDRNPAVDRTTIRFETPLTSHNHGLRCYHSQRPRQRFGVSFPDFPGCITAGRTLDEAKDMASRGFEWTYRSDARRRRISARSVGSRRSDETSSVSEWCRISCPHQRAGPREPRLRDTSGGRSRITRQGKVSSPLTPLAGKHWGRTSRSKSSRLRSASQSARSRAPPGMCAIRPRRNGRRGPTQAPLSLFTRIEALKRPPSA
jgi:hypothetical protein